MKTCPQCGAPAPDNAASCSSCGGSWSDQVPTARAPSVPATAGGGTAGSTGRKALAEILGSRYEIVSRLGAGAFGEVYKARDTVLNRMVAIKRIRLDAFADPTQLDEVKQRFLREAQVAAQLKHPNIVTVHDIVSAPEMSFIVMEFIEGMTLQSVLASKKRLSLAETLDIISQAADALDHAHREKVVHRDVKPANIMIEPSGRVKVTDFGIAKADSSSNLTATGSILGTPNYMSPEQARGGQVDGRSDLFSLGCILYECLAGEKPFRGESVATVLMRILTEEPPPIDCDRVGLPGAVQTVVSRALAKDPAHRFATGADLVQTLRSIPALDLTVPTLGLGETLVDPGPHPRTRRQPPAEGTARAANAAPLAAARAEEPRSVTIRRPTPSPAPQPAPARGGGLKLAGAAVLVLLVGGAGLAGLFWFKMRGTLESPPPEPGPSLTPSSPSTSSPATPGQTSPGSSLESSPTASVETSPAGPADGSSAAGTPLASSAPPRPSPAESSTSGPAERVASSPPEPASRATGPGRETASGRDKTERPSTTAAAVAPGSASTASAPPPDVTSPPSDPRTEPEPGSDRPIFEGSQAGRRLAETYRRGGGGATNPYGGLRFRPRARAEGLTGNERAAADLLLAVARLQAARLAASGSYGTPGDLLQSSPREAQSAGLRGKNWMAHGYRFHVERPRADFFFAVAIPVKYGETGVHSFYIDAEGVLRAGDKAGQPANASDPPF